MSATEKIAEVLREHQWYDATDVPEDPAIGCIGCDDWFSDEDALDNGRFAAHQAEMLAPLIREAQAEAVRDYLENKEVPRVQIEFTNPPAFDPGRAEAILRRQRRTGQEGAACR